MWQICGDLKISTILLQQLGFTSYPCFIWEWNNEARKEASVKKKLSIEKKINSRRKR